MNRHPKRAVLRHLRVLVVFGLVNSLVIKAQTSPSPVTSQVNAEQSGDQSGYHLSVQSRIVVLDIVVTDKHGKLVPRNDLTRDDFIVYESKVPQKIISFETPVMHLPPSLGKPVVTSAADLKKIGDAPVTIMVLDEMNSQFQDLSFARQMMVKYLQAQPPVLRQPTLLMIAQNTKFVQVHDYTQGRDELVEIVKKHMPEYPWRMMNSTGGGPGAVERMAQGLAALQQLAQATRGIPGRKNIIWVGNGFPSADLTGLDQRDSDIITGAVRAVTGKLLASRVTVYTINPTATQSSTIDVETPDDLNTSTAAATGADPFGGLVGFSDFAPATGGMAFQGRNDLNNVIAEGIDQGNQYYTLSYSPSDKSNDPAKFRKIAVVMKNPALRATTRNGYYQETSADLNPVLDKTISDKQKQRDLQLDLSQALTSDLAYNGLDITVQKIESDSYTVHVTGANLSGSDPVGNGPQHTEVTLAAAWYDSKGKLLGHVADEKITIRQAAADGALFAVTLPKLPFYAKKIRFVVRDAMNGVMGTADISR